MKRRHKSMKGLASKDLEGYTFQFALFDGWAEADDRTIKPTKSVRQQPSWMPSADVGTLPQLSYAGKTSPSKPPVRLDTTTPQITIPASRPADIAAIARARASSLGYLRSIGRLAVKKKARSYADITDCELSRADTIVDRKALSPTEKKTLIKAKEVKVEENRVRQQQEVQRILATRKGHLSTKLQTAAQRRQEKEEERQRRLAKKLATYNSKVKLIDDRRAKMARERVVLEKEDEQFRAQRAQLLSEMRADPDLASNWIVYEQRISALERESMSGIVRDHGIETLPPLASHKSPANEKALDRRRRNWAKTW